MDLSHKIFSFIACFCLLGLSRALPVERKLPLQQQRGRSQRFFSLVTALRNRRSLANFISSGAGPSTPTATDNVLIQCKNGWLLAVYNDGAVNGTSNLSSPYIELQLQSIGNSVIRILSLATGRYIAMNNTGKVYTTQTATEDTKFKISYESTSFTTFASNTHFNHRPLVNGKHMFLSIRGNGLMRNGRKTRRYHKTSGFSVLRRKRDP